MEVVRYAAFTDRADGGNPAGVVLDATGASTSQLQEVARAVGYSETAFLVPTAEDAAEVRYFSPRAEVAFCGHATIAAALAWTARAAGAMPRHLRFSTAAGVVPVAVRGTPGGLATATLTSVATRTAPLSPSLLRALVAALGWRGEELDPSLPPAIAFAGAWHPVLAAQCSSRLDELDYDVAELGALMARHGWTTVALVHRASDAEYQARNPFPPGGVYEDPATGAAAAALGGYLRERSLLPDDGRFVVHQGRHVGRPSRIEVQVSPDPGQGVQVSGTAALITA